MRRRAIVWLLMLDIVPADGTIIGESPGTVNASANGRGYVFSDFASRVDSHPILCHPITTPGYSITMAASATDLRATADVTL